MLSRTAKMILTATSLAPVLCAFGIAQIAQGKSFRETYGWFVACGSLVLLAFLVLEFAKRHLAIESLKVKKVKGSDREVLTFLLAYLLPLLARDSFDVSKNIYVTLYVFIVILLTIYHSNAFDFNPLLGMIGYHFYEVEAEDGMPFLLITRKSITKQAIDYQIVKLSDSIFLERSRA